MRGLFDRANEDACLKRVCRTTVVCERFTFSCSLHHVRTPETYSVFLLQMGDSTKTAGPGNFLLEETVSESNTSSKTHSDTNGEESKVEVYHERQSLQRCAMHAMNNLLQRRAFEPKDLDKVPFFSIVHSRNSDHFCCAALDMLFAGADCFL